MTPDPIGLAAGVNRYAYVLNNPVNTIDPYGLTAAAGTGCGPSPAMHPGFWPGTPENDAAVKSLNSLLRYIFSDKNIMRSVKIAIAISGHGPLILEAKKAKKSKKVKPGAKPKDVPTGTIPIDKKGLSKDDIHTIKDGIGAGPQDYVGISPDGDVISGDSQGNAVNNGPYGDYLPHNKRPF